MSDASPYPRLTNHAATRRQVITGTAAAFGALAMSATEAWAVIEQEVSHTAEAIHQAPVFKANPKRVYEALTDAKRFDKVTQLVAGMRSGMSVRASATQISQEVGGTFSLFGGHIVGRHLELVPNQRIVQAWRVVDWAPVLIPSRNLTLWSRVPQPKSFSTTPASQKAWPNTWRKDGRATIGTRWKNF